MNEQTSASNWLKVVGAMLSVWVTLAVLWPTLGNGWTNWDDPFYVINNPLIWLLVLWKVERQK